MKKYYLRTCVALACAFGLAACGGDDADLQLRVSIIGLTKTGLTLKNNGGEPEPVDHLLTVFTFKDWIGTDSNFFIETVGQPSNANCKVENGKGKTSTYAPNNIFVQCTPNPHNVIAKITGLAGATTNLVVVNGSARHEIAPATTSYKFTKYAADGITAISGQVGDGVAYGFVVLTQPTGKTCTIPNGGGIMGAADVTIDIICE
jgi:hypothetical protein